MSTVYQSSGNNDRHRSRYKIKGYKLLIVNSGYVNTSYKSLLTATPLFSIELCGNWWLNTSQVQSKQVEMKYGSETPNVIFGASDDWHNSFHIFTRII